MRINLILASAQSERPEVVLSSDKFYSDLFEDAHTESNAKEVANIITTELMGLEDTREKREASKPKPKPKPQKPLTAKEKAQREVDARYGRTPWNKKGSLGT